MAEGRQPTVVGTPNFRVVFFTVVALTMFLLCREIALSFIQGPSEQQRTILTGCDILWKAGVGTIFGLIGGKVT